MIKKLLGTILLCAGLVVQSLPAQAAVLEPRECPKDLKYLLGMYKGTQWGTGTFIPYDP